MTSPAIDPDRLEQEWEADREVLAELVANGDKPALPRAIDVSFRGPPEALDELADAAEELGFEVLESEAADDGGDPYLFLEIEQAADEASIRALTIRCIEIEARFGVEYDGWGCQAQTGKRK